MKRIVNFLSFGMFVSVSDVKSKMQTWHFLGIICTAFCHTLINILLWPLGHAESSQLQCAITTTFEEFPNLLICQAGQWLISSGQIAFDLFFFNYDNFSFVILFLWQSSHTTIKLLRKINKIITFWVDWKYFWETEMSSHVNWKYF